MGDLLGSPRVAPLLFATLVETALLHPFFLFFPSSPTLCACAVTSSFPSLRCHRWGPPLIACRRGPAPPSRSLGNCFLKIVAKITSCTRKIVTPRRKRLIFFRNDTNVQSAKCF